MVLRRVSSTKSRFQVTILDKQLYLNALNDAMIYHEAGRVTKSVGLVYEAFLPGAAVGSLCRIYKGRGVSKQQMESLAKSTANIASSEYVDSEVIGFRDKNVILMPFEDGRGIHNDSVVVLLKRRSAFPVGPALLGRVIDGRGHAIDGGKPIEYNKQNCEERNLYEKPVSPMSRSLISTPLDLGVRAINGLLTCGKGQRTGIMAGSGVGKSVLLGMMAKNTSAEINVIALIGERGREVREFIENDLGPEGLKRSVIIVATSDVSPLLRVRSAFLAASIAEYFRDRGRDVLFLMDSVTRFCMAQREIGLSLGEPPASKGYTPSVFAMLPKLLERAGTGPAIGSITGLFTVLVEGDDLDEPIADASRSFLDGHIVLSRKIAERNHYPAIDVLQSTSRVMSAITTPDHRKWAAEIREWMATYSQFEDLINIGAYSQGANAAVDQAVYLHDRISQFLRQTMSESVSFADTIAAMQGISRAGEAFLAANQAKTRKTELEKPVLRFG